MLSPRGSARLGLGAACLLFTLCVALIGMGAAGGARAGSSAPATVRPGNPAPVVNFPGTPGSRSGKELAVRTDSARGGADLRAGR